MNNSLQRPTSHSAPQGVNPFARALAETRGSTQSDLNMDELQNPNLNTNPMTGQNGFLNESGMDYEEQQRLMKERAQKERLRQQLHRQVNPIEMQDVYSAKENQVKKEIEKIQHELKLLSKEIQDFYKEVDIAAQGNIAAPGMEGKYHLNFLQKLREWIMFLRQKISSARTWANTYNSKKSKKKSRGGILIEGQGHKETKAVWDRMGQERSNLYASG
jgi:hypothetical protein